MNLSPSSPVYELWRDAPVDIYHKFYFFNITNPVEVEREGGEQAFDCDLAKTMILEVILMLSLTPSIQPSPYFVRSDRLFTTLR